MTLCDLALIGAFYVAFAAASVHGGPKALSAHSLWAVRASMIGSTTGALSLILMRWTDLPIGSSLALSGIGFLLAFAVAGLGKHALVVSFVDDALAGRVWFIGWLVIPANLFGLVDSLVFRSRVLARF